MGNFNYPPTVPAYKPICKFLMNCPLKTAFTKCPSVLYRNFLREFWCTAIGYHPNPSTDEDKPRLLKEFLIKFTTMNGKKPLNLDFNILTTSTCIDYNNGAYVAHPSPEAVKAELAKMVTNPSYLDKTPVLKNSFPVAWRILLTFVIQVLGENYSSTEQVNSIQQLITYSFITRTKVDIGEIIYSDLVTKLLNKSRLRYVSYPRFISCALKVLLGLEYTQNENFGYLPSIMSNFNFSKDPSKVTETQLTAHMIAVNNEKNSVSPLPLFATKKKGKNQTVTPTLPKSQGPEAFGVLSKKRKHPKPKKTPSETKGTCKSQPLPEGTTTDPKDLRGNDQLADKGLPSTASYEGTTKTTPRPEGPLRDKESGGNKPPTDMEPINPTVADPSGIGANDKEEVFEAGEDMDKDTQADTEFQSLPPNADNHESSPIQDTNESTFDSSPNLKKFDNILPHSKATGYYEENINHKEQTDKVIDATMNSLDKNSIERGDLLNALNGVTEAKSSTSMAWNLGPRMTAVESSQAKIRYEISSLRKDTSDIKFMMTEIYQSFKGENVTHADTEEPPSHTEWEHAAMEEERTNAVLITTAIVTDDQPEDQRKLVPASKEIQAHLNKEEKIKKAVEEGKLFEITKTEVIMVVQEEAEKIGLDPNKIISAKACETFKKAQDAKHQVLKREHSQKSKRAM
ncbi:hypothetical protein Tco_0647136 [Tanacetum coccineum]